MGLVGAMSFVGFLPLKSCRHLRRHIRLSLGLYFVICFQIWGNPVLKIRRMICTGEERRKKCAVSFQGSRKSILFKQQLASEEQWSSFPGRLKIACLAMLLTKQWLQLTAEENPELCQDSPKSKGGTGNWSKEGSFPGIDEWKEPRAKQRS